MATWAKRTYDPAKAGGPVWKPPRSPRGVQIEQRGIDRVEAHLSRFGPDPANEAMVARLRSIADKKLTPSEEDENFYTHELRELERYIQLGWPVGQPADDVEANALWNNAHSATLEDYSLSDADLYHPSVRVTP